MTENFFADPPEWDGSFHDLISTDNRFTTDPCPYCTADVDSMVLGYGGWGAKRANGHTNGGSFYWIEAIKLSPCEHILRPVEAWGSKPSIGRLIDLDKRSQTVQPRIHIEWSERVTV